MKDASSAAQLTEYSVLGTQYSVLSFAGRVAVLVFLSLAGCGPSASPSGTGAERPLTGAVLKLVVADDPAIAAAARRLTDQWRAETGATLEVAEIHGDAWTAAGKLPGDVIICRSWLVAPLAENGLLAALPTEITRQTTGPWAATFELLRRREACWGPRVVAMPLGSPVLCLYYRADLLEKLHRAPPQTWIEYGEISRALRAKSFGLASGSFEPLGDGWAGLMLLARAASYAKQRDTYSSLFDVQTMDPLIDGPPFVRALEELAAAAKPNAAAQLTADPAAAREAIWSGRCGMAVSWPSAAWHMPQGAAALPKEAAAAISVAELPGSDQRVPLLGIDGRVAVIAANCSNPQAAGKLILWLADRRWSESLLAVSPGTTLSGPGQAAAPQAWMEHGASAQAARAYGAALADAFGRPDSIDALRLPGRDQYLAALDKAVQSAVRGQATPAEALRQAAGEWRKITARLGLEKQKTAWLHSLGLE